MGSDFILLGLLNGSVYLEFNNIGGLHSLSTIASSSQPYNDGELHQLNFTFNCGQFMLLVDSVDNSPPSSKICLTWRNYALLLTDLMIETLYADGLASTTVLYPPTLWLGGVLLTATELPQDIHAEVFNSLSGCIFNVSYVYTHTSSQRWQPPC